MSAPMLLLVPSVVRMELFRSFVDYGFLVLDVLLDEGTAGVLFRRMRLMSAFDPEMRAKYDALRACYLSSILPLVIGGQKGVVVVGTHPSDVDLIHYSSVSILAMSEQGLRDLSVAVYGEPVMLSTEYSMISGIVADSVDATHDLAAWSELDVVLSRKFVSSVIGYSRIPAAVVDAKLKAAVSFVGMSMSLLEPEVDLYSPAASVHVALSFDYLTAIAAKWRDAVVGLLGSTPSIEMAFKLPWFVVDVPVFRCMCYRLNAKGVPAMSMQGESLVDLVTNRMAGAFTPGELAGTWVGALLSERATAAQAAKVLRGRSMVSSMASSGQTWTIGDGAVAPSFVVMEEVAWMYATSPGVAAVDSEHEMSRLIETSVATMPLTYELATRFSRVVEQYKRVEVTSFMRRVHQLGDRAVAFIAECCRVLDVVDGDSGMLSDADMMILQLLPGATYLGFFSEKTRLAAYKVLGLYPSLAMCDAHVVEQGVQEPMHLHSEFQHMATKLAVLSGTTVDDIDVAALPVGADGDPFEPDGYCYLTLFDELYHAHLRQECGAFPTLAQVLEIPYGWRRHRYADVVKVSLSHLGDGRGLTLHFSLDYGIRFGEIVKTRSWPILGSPVWSPLLGLSVGAIDGHKWFVIGIVSITISVMLLVFIIGWAIYKCRGQSRGGGIGRRY